MNFSLKTMPTLALLAGGLATRLYPLTEKIPKSLLMVAGEPFLGHQLRLIRKQGIKKVVLCVGYLGNMVADYAGSGAAFDLEIVYSMDGPAQLGTGGALKQAIPHLGTEFLVMYGDSYLPTSFAAVVSAFRQGKHLALMTVFQNHNQWDGSNIVYKKGEILAYDKINKTPEMAYIDYGLGCFSADAFKSYPAGVKLDLAAIYKDLLSQRQLGGYEVRERFYEIGSHVGLAETTDLLQSK